MKYANLNHQQVITWLQEQAYPLEMTVATAFQRAGFSVRLSDSFTDFETKETHTIDVTAFRWSSTEEPFALQVGCRVTCQSNQDKPWVVLIPKFQYEQLNPNNLVCSKIYQRILAQAMKEPSFQTAIRNLKLLMPPHIGYGLVQILSDNQSEPYSSVINTFKAALEQTTQFREINISNSALHACVSLPVVVIDGQLFEYIVTDDGKPSLHEVFSSVIYWKNGHPNFATPIHVVTEAGLNHFVARINATFNELINLSLPQIVQYSARYYAPSI